MLLRLLRKKRLVQPIRRRPVKPLPRAAFVVQRQT